MIPPTPDSDIAVLSHRVGALEKVHEQLFEQLRDLNKRQEERHEAIALKLDAAMTHLRAHACPTPGACVSLIRDVADLIKVGERHEKTMEKHDIHIAELRTTAAEGRAGLRVTIFWVGIMSSGLGALASMVLPMLLKRL